MITIHWSILALIAGGSATAGVFIIALCAAAGNADRQLENINERSRQ